MLISTWHLILTSPKPSRAGIIILMLQIRKQPEKVIFPMSHVYMWKSWDSNAGLRPEVYVCSSHSATFNALHVSKINFSTFLYTVSFLDFLISALIHPGPLDQPLMFPLNSCIPSVPKFTPILSCLVPPWQGSHHFFPAIVA